MTIRLEGTKFTQKVLHIHVYCIDEKLTEKILNKV